ncbi:unnamed protein product, partial [Rotaria magnacalcarata]
VNIKVNFVRNHTNDDHFDLIHKRKLLVKTMAYLSRDGNHSSIISLQILGNILYKKLTKRRQIKRHDLRTLSLQAFSQHYSSNLIGK